VTNEEGGSRSGESSGVSREGASVKCQGKGNLKGKGGLIIAKPTSCIQGINFPAK